MYCIWQSWSRMTSTAIVHLGKILRGVERTSSKHSLSGLKAIRHAESRSSFRPQSSGAGKSLPKSSSKEVRRPGGHFHCKHIFFLLSKTRYFFTRRIQKAFSLWDSLVKRIFCDPVSKKCEFCWKYGQPQRQLSSHWQLILFRGILSVSTLHWKCPPKDLSQRLWQLVSRMPWTFFKSVHKVSSKLQVLKRPKDKVCHWTGSPYKWQAHTNNVELS